jgi:hypothetical protein
MTLLISVKHETLMMTVKLAEGMMKSIIREFMATMSQYVPPGKEKYYTSLQNLYDNNCNVLCISGEIIKKVTDMKDFSSTNRFLDLKDVMNNLINSFSFDIYSYEVVLSLHKEDLCRLLKQKMLHKVRELTK